MTHAELLRRDAELAMREGGMYYSGEYLSRMAIIAESLEAENAKLRELVRHLYTCMSNIDIDGNYECFLCEYENTDGLCDYERLMRELGVEVNQ